ncbi:MULTISPECIES: DUF1361 domain-containing protein [Microbacterium]|uniref:DUF1361 domain-containing protein n=1 Tax=Microbacterium TaxID=33882 RepID=UPI0027873C46|nr:MULTISPECIES: DUF1361 domain-containing protein [Microbacterium]MDQ1077002.1 putative membrane protein [Microbacterium sp. SORGH_AS_0969]MDQ1117239.1 putative membrane protein [Microbacterium testaceum]
MIVLLTAAAVLALNLYAVVLVLLRAAVYRVRLYRPMLLNVGLSFVPVPLSLVAGVGFLLFVEYRSHALDNASLLEGVLAVMALAVPTGAWLLMFPNSVYLITELNFSHRVENTPVPLWYDIVQTLALTLAGIANAILSLVPLQMFVIIGQQRGDQITVESWVFAGIVILLGAVGMYLGRYLRFNSWDVRHPKAVAHKLRSHLRERGKMLEAVGFVATHAVLVTMLYVPLFLLAWSSVVAAGL